MKDKIDELYQKYINGILPLIFDQNSPKYDFNRDISWHVKNMGITEKNPNVKRYYFIDNEKYCDGLLRVNDSTSHDYNFVDENGTLISDTWFVEAFPFKDGIARVKKNGKWNYIDKKGKPLFDTWFDYIKCLDNGSFVVCNNKKFCLANKEGKYITDYIWFDDIDDFQEGFARVKLDNQWSFINENGELLRDPNNNKILRFMYVGRFSEGYAMVMETTNPTISYINTNGEFISDKWTNSWKLDTSRAYEDEYDFSCGYVLIKKDNLFNFIDKNGNLISDTWYDKAFPFKDGIAKVQKDNRTNFIDTNGNLIRDSWFYQVSDFCNGIAIATRYYPNDVMNSDYIYIIDKNGKEINDIGPIDHYISLPDNSGFIIERFNKKREITVINVNSLCPKWYTIIKRYDSIFQPTALIFDGKKYNILDYNTGKFISDEWFDNVYSYYDYLFRVEKNGKYNYFYKNGDFMSDVWFDDFSEFKNYYAAVKNNGLYNIFNFDEGLLLKEWIKDKIEVGHFSVDKGYGHSVYGYTLIKYGNKSHKKRAFVIDENGKRTSDVFKIDDEFRFHNMSFGSDNGNYECISIDLNGYTVKKSLFGYVCEKGEDKFRLKYEPIKIYDKRYVLCYDNKNVFLLDRINNVILEVRSPKEIAFSSNFILDYKNKKVLFVYNNEILDITNYFVENIIGKSKIGINFDVEIKSKDDFTFENEEEINKELDKEREEQKKLQEAKREEEEKKKLEEAKIKETQDQRNLALEQKEALQQLKNALEKLEALGAKEVPIQRIGVKNIFITVDNHREINPMYLSNGLLKYVDFSLQSFENVKMDGIDFSGCNIHFDPQKVYQRNLRNCNLKKVYISPFMNFADVDIRGASFSDDDDPKTVDGFNASFRNAIYDEHTTYNGKPFTEAFGECKNKPDIKVITKEE